MVWLALAVMGVCAGALIALPFLAPARGDDAPARNGRDDLRAELEAIDSALARGDLGEDGARAARLDAERRALRAVDYAAPAPNPASRRAGAIAAGVLVSAAAGLYAIMGRPDIPSARPLQQGQVQNELERVTVTLERRLQQTPQDGEGWRALGWAYFIAARYEDAIEAYARAVELQPENAGYRSLYGEALVGAGGGVVSPQAAAAFRAALERDKGDVRARFYLGLLAAQEGKAKAAIDAWLTLYREAPPGGEAAQDLRTRIEALAKEQGIDVSASLGPQIGPTAQDVENAARLSDQERDAMIEAMVTTLDQRLRADPRDLEGWVRLVRARVVQGKTDDARDALARARAAFAGDRDALTRLDQAGAEAGIR